MNEKTLAAKQSTKLSWKKEEKHICDFFNFAPHVLPQTIAGFWGTLKTLGFDWWALQDSNLRPAD